MRLRRDGGSAGRIPALLVAAAGLGCSAARPPVPLAHDLAPADPGAPAFVSPARWDYHPPAPTTALASVKLPDGGCAFTAEGGQRWSAAATKQLGARVICSGKAEASFAVAPEDLTSAIRRADGTWIYVGETGTLYETGEPLGGFTRTVPAPEPLAKVAGVGAEVLAATLEGKLLRWGPQSGWRPGGAAPALAGAHVFDLVADGPRVLALAFPEALLTSEDAGVTWTAAGAPTVGARRLGRTAAGDLGAQGIFESVVWRAATFARGTDRLVVPQATLEIELGRAPSAAAVQAGHALLDGDRYHEIVHPDSDGEPWLFSRGRLEGRLETEPIPWSAPCTNLRLGARGRIVFLACIFPDGSEIAADVRRSTDAGTSWSAPLHLVTPDGEQVAIAVAPDGAALISGACRSSDPAGACKPSGPLLLRPLAADADAGPVDAGSPDPIDAGLPERASPSLGALASSAPQLAGPALGLAFAVDGRSAYFLGKRGKDERIGLFVSHDGGETFSPRVLQSAPTAHPARPPHEDDEPSEGEQPPDTFELDETSPIRPGDDGTLSLMVARTRGGVGYLTADEDGRVLQVAAPPLDEDGNAVDVVLSGQGKRVLALPSNLSDGAGTFWESLDGGINWDRQTLPQALVREYTKGNIAFACGLAGCVIGDTVSRVGWGSAGETGAADRTADPPPAGTQAVLTPISCDLSAGGRWARVDDYLVPGTSSSPLPTVHEIMRGRSVWSALSLDGATGALTATTATLGESGEGEARVIRRPLVGPHGAHTATAISATQVEGYVVVRAPYPVDAHGQPLPGGPLRNVEVAWENFIEGTSARVRIPDAGPLTRGDVTLAPGALDQLNASMISISSRGLFVRLQAPQEIFVDPSGRVERFTPAPFPGSGPLGTLDFRAEPGSLGGELLGVGLLQDPEHNWLAVALAKRVPGGGWSYLADALLPQRQSGLAVFTTWGSSSSGPLGVTALVADPQHGRAWAHFIGFRGDGSFLPAQPVATLLDLGERPRPCTLAERTGTARAAIPFKLDRTVLFPGARHPVLVHEPRAKNAVGVAEPVVLMTSGAVVHGTPTSPCLAAFQADGIGNPSIGAVVPGDLSRAWLFRLATDAPARPGPGRRPDPSHSQPGVTLEYRPMVCRYDPSARIPEVVWAQEGTTRP